MASTFLAVSRWEQPSLDVMDLSFGDKSDRQDVTQQVAKVEVLLKTLALNRKRFCLNHPEIHMFLLGVVQFFIFKVLQVQDCVTEIWKSIIHPLLDHTEEWQCFGWRYQNLF